ncbi:hypothetical protein PFICI_02967 [Pestalotiopsis fici W106-1]|uniref:Acyl-CoA thioesterase II n=1 Tax=Pestalotiopsis fici (strain W106-1 / CGMCC3.15140) TaxID=1229662 RepID=W3XHM6_PESFW|nr:uncharacterized protein PFICI_02967 [Pestalotiopsis fici W106-1]ETS84942.1 hypothetical protein PFICI_02967 [Pestalotiopsis fici W106-1]
MAARSLLGVLTSVTPAPELGRDIYTNQGPLIQQPVGEAAFGGSILSQAISAAAATVQPLLHVVSSQSSFLRPVQASSHVHYHVERTSDGRTSATRVVRATQGGGGPCLYVAIISFQTHGLVTPANNEHNALKYAEPLPDLGGLHPHSIPKQDFPQLFQLSDESLQVLSKFGVSADDPFDWRLLPLEKSVCKSNSAQIHTYAFVRAEPRSTHSGISHLAAMAFLSDISLLELSLMANWESVHEDARALAMSTTLNSQITLHSPTARIDEWMVCESGISWVKGGRVTNYQRFWNAANGEILMECTQDAIIKHGRAQI